MADGYSMHHFWAEWNSSLCYGITGSNGLTLWLVCFLGGRYSREWDGKANGYGSRYRSRRG